MKVIFLDLDGVLNSSITKAKLGDFIGIDNAKVRLLKKIIDATGAEIVISSSWRLGYNNLKEEFSEPPMDYLKRKLRRSNLRFIDTTPKLDHRSNEIRAWLKKNDDVVKNYVILDDEDWWKNDDELRSDWVETHYYGETGGLQEEHVEQAIKILNGEGSEKRTEEEEKNKAEE